MRICSVIWITAFGLAAYTSAQQPSITSFQRDGTITWANTSTDCVAVVEELSPATSNEWSAIHVEPATATVASVQLATTSSHAWFRVANSNESSIPPGMVLVPGGSFQMGDTFGEGWDEELPVHSVYVSAFYIEQYEVTKAKWDEVYNWAVTHGYTFLYPASGKASDHPVHTVDWYDCVKWANARSEMEGLTPAYYTSSARLTVYRMGEVDVQNDWVRWDTGYRLSTEAEWEKAARGGLVSKRFPLGNTISHGQANYEARSYDEAYDLSRGAGSHPDYDDVWPYTSPVGSFAPNAYGLYDMAGNVRDWCWDWWDDSYYSTSPGVDPRGPASGPYRVQRGGDWYDPATFCRVVCRSGGSPGNSLFTVSFRLVRAAQ